MIFLKKFILILIILVIVFSPINTQDTSAGSGTSEDPYVISSFSELEKIGEPGGKYPLDAHYILGRSIDASITRDENYKEGRGWQPIGSSDDQSPFTGSFDGRGFQIKNLNINRPGEERVGLFAETNGAVIKNLRLTEVSIRGGKYVGAVCGINKGTIHNVFLQGEIKGDFVTGGLAGWNYTGIIEQVLIRASISGRYNLGGLVGRNSSGTISHIHAQIQVGGDDRNIGGLVGYNTEYSTVENTKTSGKVSGYERVGGVVGLNSGTVEDSSFSGEIAGDWMTGNLIGWDTTD